MQETIELSDHECRLIEQAQDILGLASIEETLHYLIQCQIKNELCNIAYHHHLSL